MPYVAYDNAGNVTSQDTGAAGGGGGSGSPGATGPAGAAGLSVLSGSGAPANTLGVNGQPGYWDYTTPAVYGPKASGAWPAGQTVPTLQWFSARYYHYANNAAANTRYPTNTLSRPTADTSATSRGCISAFNVPFSGTIRMLQWSVQLVGTDQPRNIIISKASMSGVGAFTDYVSVPAPALSTPSGAMQTWAQNDASVAVTQGDILRVIVVYSTAGASIEANIDLTIACPGVL